MAKLANKAKARKSTGSTGRLASKATSMGMPEKSPDELLAENSSLPTITSQPPTPPAPLPYLRFFSTIPGLRNKQETQ